MGKMNQFLENHKLPKLIQDELAISIKRIEFMVKNLLKNKISRSRWCHWRILPNSSRRISTNSPQSLPENRRRHLPTHFMRPVLPWPQNLMTKLLKKKNNKTPHFLNKKCGFFFFFPVPGSCIPSKVPTVPFGKYHLILRLVCWGQWDRNIILILQMSKHLSSS